MIQGVLLSALAGIVIVIAAIIGVVVWVVLTLMKGELNLKIGNSDTPPNPKPKP